MHSLFLALGAFLVPFASAASGPESTRLLRYPDIHGDTVVFCYGGDLWTAPVAGGTASRLTAHPGQEVFPRFVSFRQACGEGGMTFESSEEGDLLWRSSSDGRLPQGWSRYAPASSVGVDAKRSSAVA